MRSRIFQKDFPSMIIPRFDEVVLYQRFEENATTAILWMHFYVGSTLLVVFSSSEVLALISSPEIPRTASMTESIVSWAADLSAGSDLITKVSFMFVTF